MSVFTWRGALLVSIPIVAIALLTISAFTVRLSGHPRFCTSCHLMEEYYDSWMHSSHRDVKCVECHYEPGLKAELRGKFDGAIQLLKYVSGTYAQKPHAEVSDASCMREGCHSSRAQDPSLAMYKGKVVFDHARHLTSKVRGKELRCTSCHFQLVEGEHIGVSPSTCTICHFYKREDAPVIAATCLACHPVPEAAVEFASQRFSHKDFLEGKDKLNCIHCHSNVTEGDGAVSPLRCLACHLERDIELPEQSVFHGIHVSKKHIECLQCHDQIRHGTIPMQEQMLTSGNCNSCHGGTRHALQERVYKGIAADGLDPEPDVMYLAGVSCEGCHTEKTETSIAGVQVFGKLSDARACADCHGDEAYGEMLTMWQNEVRAELSALKAQLQEADDRHASYAAGREQPDGTGTLEELYTLLARAKNDIAAVELDGSSGAHNYFYVMTVLDRARTDLARHEKLLADTVPGSTGQESQ